MVSSEQDSQFTGKARKKVRRIEKALERGYDVLVEFTYRLNGQLKSINHWISVTVENVWRHISSIIPQGHMVHDIRIVKSQPAEAVS